jgi:excisionase family DNA binding protein
MSTGINIRLAFTVSEAAQTSSIGRTAIFEAIRSGKLVARKYGRRTLIAADDLKAFLNNLPSSCPKTNLGESPSSSLKADDKAGRR